MLANLVAQAPASPRQLVRSYAMDTSQATGVAAPGFEERADHRGLGMENRVMIQPRPLPDMPDELCLVRVPDPYMVWTSMLLGHTLIPYPFSIKDPPTWDEFRHVIQRAICSNINEELGDAE